MSPSTPKTILTVFAGRRQNMEISRKYFEKALESKILDEVHFWNNTRYGEDEEYLKKVSNLKRTSSSGTGYYVQITPVINNNSFELLVRAPHSAHVKLSNGNTEYEIVLGMHNNAMTILLENNREICRNEKPNMANNDSENKYNFSVVDNNLIVKVNDEIIINHPINGDNIFDKIYFKTGFGAIGHLNYEPTQNKGFYFMDTCEKNWRNYYQYYTIPGYGYENSVILKCDDDIVFMDLTKMQKYIDFVRNNDYDLVFANTINNGVSAYFQQNKYNLIPKEIMDLEYPDNGLCGSLWDSGNKAERLHNFFIENYSSFLNKEYNDEIIDITTRYSINFFGFKGEKWHKITDCFVDDEYNLTVEFVKNRQFKNILYSDFYVSHLSFFRQIETGINLDDLRGKYKMLYSTIYP
jgi:hypothetical protein